MTIRHKAVSAGIALVLAGAVSFGAAPAQTALADPASELAAVSQQLDSLGAQLADSQAQLAEATTQLENTDYEIAEKQARSIKYQMTTARLPLAKDLGDFTFDGTPINATLVHDLASGEFLAHERNVVLVGGTGTGKTHLAIAIARACIRKGARAASSTSSTWSTSSRPRAVPAARAGWPTISHG